ncbi:hypothetical protein [Priestia sp. YIM B13486]|uniref:hypothetical protein n=1 Tax=Priestia sp. YIM B13486 TaxID=3366304 RepID=UPI003670B2D0
MRGRPELEIEREKVYKTKKNPNGTFIARIIQVPKEENMLNFILEIKNLKKKELFYRSLLVRTENWYYSFRLARGDLKWVSLHTVAVWDRLGHKLVEVAAPTGKENYRISDEHCSVYREK